MTLTNIKSNACSDVPILIPVSFILGYINSRQAKLSTGKTPSLLIDPNPAVAPRIVIVAQNFVEILRKSGETLGKKTLIGLEIHGV